MNRKKLRLLLFADCNRHCAGCCNKDWNLESLPICTDYTPYDEILLTGGEPMLKPDLTVQAIQEIRQQTNAPIILYTADLAKPIWLYFINSLIDGLTVTLHTPGDVRVFESYDRYFTPPEHMKGRMRLNVFKEAGEVRAKPHWKVKPGMEWIKNCPLPEGEVLMKYEGDKTI